MIIPYNNNGYFMMFPFLPPNCDKPPTLYSILNSIVNGTKDDDEEEVKIKDLAKEGRTTIFNFDYPLTSNIDRETFETIILNHYLQRRIGFDTVTAFRIALYSKLNEIMPMYNKMFDALDNWDIFNDGETLIRTGTDNRATSNTNSLQNQSSASGTSDRRNSELPQSEIVNVQNASYLTDYNYDTTSTTDSSTSSGTSNGTDNKQYTETITKSPQDKVRILKDMQDTIKSIYTLIFDDLDVLFYGLL